MTNFRQRLYLPPLKGEQCGILIADQRKGEDHHKKEDERTTRLACGAKKKRKEI